MNMDQCEEEDQYTRMLSSKEEIQTVNRNQLIDMKKWFIPDIISHHISFQTETESDRIETKNKKSF